MADEEQRYESVALIIEKILGCPPHLLADLSPRQLAALHLYKHKLMAATHRLYMAVPAERADQVLSRLLKDIAERLP